MGVLSWIGRFDRRFCRSGHVSDDKKADAWAAFRFPQIVYEPEGQSLINTLWEEAMAEYSFAGVSDILESLKH